MKKGERTRSMIVEKSAPVFNKKGYSGSSMGDLVRETGLEKGSIYNHFVSKQQLALEAFDYSVGIMAGRYRAALSGLEGAPERLAAVIDVFGGMAKDPPVAGGCPILNTAVEADDSDPVLKEKARQAMTGLHKLIGKIIKEGVRDGELSSETDPYEVASVVTATLEGALMLSKLYDDPAHMQRAVSHAKRYVTSLTRGGRRSET
jgi:AcrR family transcriptional regulator